MYIKQGTTTKIVPIPPLFKTSYNYKFNSRELQDELGLNMYDLGARGYMPDTGRLTTIDPKSEKYAFQSPFAIAVNNPVFFVDINGEGVDTDLIVDSSGLIRRADYNDGSEKNATDRILKSDGKGNVDTKEVKNADGTTTKTPEVAVDNIAKGIVNDGDNFKDQNNTIKFGGANQPTKQNIIDFLVQFSENVTGVEIAGFVGINTSTAQSSFLIHQYSNNTATTSESSLRGLNEIVDGSLIKEHFHTHPDRAGYSNDELNTPSEDSNSNGGSDISGKNQRDTKGKAQMPSYIYNKNGTYKY
jgi:RHS repeat-associated protein